MVTLKLSMCNKLSIYLCLNNLSSVSCSQDITWVTKIIIRQALLWTSFTCRQNFWTAQTSSMRIRILSVLHESTVNVCVVYASFTHSLSTKLKEFTGYFFNGDSVWPLLTRDGGAWVICFVKWDEHWMCRYLYSLLESFQRQAPEKNPNCREEKPLRSTKRLSGRIKFKENHVFSNRKVSFTSRSRCAKLTRDKILRW